ncbi:MAG: hypothetical protein RJA10_4641 [Pseudomonadota bacterium]|jgi:uncharacterized SAM-binding protein YcdF (DUF218 family)
MNAWLQMLGIDGLKPFVTALLLPPVPWLALIVLGAWRMRRRRWLGGSLVMLGVALEWISCTQAAGALATRWLLQPPPALTDLKPLKTPLPSGQTVIVVLGGGRIDTAEYPHHSLSTISMERLRYGIWLSRETGLPWAFTGGLSPGSDPGPTEAAIAARVGREEFRHPLRWAEDQSRDTRENAVRTLALLKQEGVGRIVLVTHDMHMQRSLRNFQRARAAAGMSVELVPAPVGSLRKLPQWVAGDFYPTARGITQTRYALREWLALLAGA